MTKKSGQSKAAADKLVKSIRRKTRQTYSSEEKIRIVLAGLRGEESISALCRREGIAESLYYSWSKEFLEAGKRRLSGDTARQATSPEVKDLRSESLALKECVAASETLQLFARLLGLLVRELVVQYLPFAGIYFAGSVSRGVLGAGMVDTFERVFVEQGHFFNNLADLPIKVISDDAAGLLGCGVKPQDLSADV